MGLLKLRRPAVLTLVVAMLAALTAPALADDEVGLVDSNTGQWHLRNEAGSISSFYYGNPGDFPFSGDWDCDGSDTPGLYRQSDGFVYLRNSNTQGVANIRFFFGNPGDIPLPGDFNGDGCDTVSIYRPSEARIYIINELGENDGGLGAADYSFLFGNAGDTPVVGDFDGDAIDEIGLYRESTGYFYYRDTLTTGIATGQFYFGNPGDRFVAGDWGVPDGIDTPGVFRPAEAKFYLKHTNSEGIADEEVSMGSGAWLPIAGKWSDTPISTSETGKSESGSDDAAGSTGEGSDEPTDDTTGEFNWAIPEPAPTLEPTTENIEALLQAAESAESTEPKTAEFMPLHEGSGDGFTPQYAGYGQSTYNTAGTGYLDYNHLPASVGYLALWRNDGAGWYRLDGNCSATVIGRDMIVTAAHCIRLTGANGFVFYPDKWGFDEKYGSWAGTSFRIPSYYDQGLSQKKLWMEAFDFAFIKLATNSSGHIGDAVGTHRVLYNAHNATANVARRSIGYPAEGWYGTKSANYPCSPSSCVPYYNQTNSNQGGKVHWGNGWYSFVMGGWMHGGNSGGPVLAWWNNKWWVTGVVSNGGYVISCPTTGTCNSSRGYYMRNIWGPSFRNGNFPGSFSYEWSQANLLP